jgi:ABC-2 type transport system permease protein
VRLLAVQLRASSLLAMQYRSDFVIDAFIEVFWMTTALVPLIVVYGQRPAIAGWSFGEALLVTGWFMLLQGVEEGALAPSLTTVVEHIRKGTLDFVLVKPADAQFLVSTARFAPWRGVNVLTALVVFAYAFHTLGRVPSAGGVALALVLLVAAIAVLYSLWILTIAAAFYVVRIDNLTFLFSAVFDAARWPQSVFRGVIRFVFTFVVPLALMTTYPARALLGTLDLRTFVFSILGAIAFVLLSRAVWARSISRYTSASS